MLWAAAAAGLVPAVFSAIRAGKQRKEADKLARMNAFPTQEVPDAVKEAEQISQNAALTGLPSASYQNAQKNIQRSAATAMAGAKDRRSALSAIPYIQQQTNDATANLDTADANARMANRSQLIGQKNLVGQYQNNAWDWNKRQKYIQQAAAVRGLLGASRENTNTALDRTFAAGLGIAGALNDKQNGWGSYSGSNQSSGAPVYANGYGANDNYSEFQTGNYE